MAELTSKDLAGVQDHYLDYPYPYRDPEEEKKRLLQIHGEYLGEMNHWLYKGKESFKNKFRILIAGGGTGDSSTFFGTQLKGTDAEIIYLDFSKNSMEVAKKRAEVRGLKNITFVNESIFNIPKLNLGKFDFIQCSGVLHHLSSPDEGLKILTDSLKDTGGMNLMVYAKYGRTGVYQIQELMRMANEGVTQRTEEVMNGKTIMSSLPATNWFVRGQDLLGDHILFGDVGLYDMFLHKQDRCYSLPELYEWVEKAGLNFIEFSDVNAKLKLRPENYVKDFSLLQKIKKMDPKKQAAMCEIICGSIIKHQFYVSKQKNPQATMDDLNNIPYFFGIANVAQQMYDHLQTNNVAIGSGISLTLNNGWLQNVGITLPVTIYTKHIFNAMREGEKSLKEIFDFVRTESGTDVKDKDLIETMKGLFAPFLETDTMLLRDKSIPVFDFDM